LWRTILRKIFPELCNLIVDLGLRHSRTLQQRILPWLEQYRDHPEDAEKNRHFVPYGDKIYLFTVKSLPARRGMKGYEIIGTDDTLDRAHINLLENFNEQLNQQVEEKTAHIVAMHNNLIMSMATMVESRDNSTGGHIRRTSEGVRLLIDAVKETGAFELSDTFCRNLIKAAPMHDLGKIAVDDAVLRKPGRFTPQEFEKMKAHAAEGARIVHEILKDTDDEDFHRIAENVAHYHHERWDGSGYPEGLKGEEIPIEARIMAIADVYDALVSKRVYKESMSFEQAHAIIMDGMGQHFDKSLQPYYLAAKPHLEDYYRSTGDCRG
jgi:putative two-component system response regulator